MDLIQFITSSRRNRFYLYSAIALIILQLVIFKIAYPHPGIIFDSHYYIQAAAFNWKVNAWPLGYSKFLQFFALFSSSTTVLVCLQYLFLEFSCLLFFFTWLLFFRPLRLTSIIVFIFLFVNPIFLFCANYILADAIFIGLSIVWFTQLFWILCQPKPYMIFTQAILLALAFTIRYNALYYPLIATLAFILSKQPLRWKLAGIALPVLLVGSFIFYTAHEVKEVTGQAQFSPFGGWKLANDALYVYKHVYSTNTEAVPEKFKDLDSTIRHYFDKPSPYEPKDMSTSDFTSGSFYMFFLTSPLMQYMNNTYGADWPFFNSRKWLKVGPLYQSYGSYLIGKYPGAFTKYFLWPNFQRYFKPPGETLEFMLSYYLPGTGGDIVKQWFGLSTLDTKEVYIQLSRRILKPYPIIFTVLHCIFILGSIAFFVLKGFSKIKKPYSYCILIVMGLWLVDFGFSVLAAGIVLRYQIFTIILETAFGLYFVEFIYKRLFHPKSASPVYL